MKVSSLFMTKDIMYKILREEYIVQQSPLMPMLVNREEQYHIALSGLECAIIEFLDGTRKYEDIVKEVCTLLNVSEEEKEIVVRNLQFFFDRFAQMIDSKLEPSKRSQIFFGDRDYVLPPELSIELTDKCVMECRHCYKDACSANNTFVNYEELIQFLKSVVGKVDSIQLTGGEAMLHPNFFEILRFCKKHFNNISISTTGLLINERNIDEFKNTHIYLSLYSFDEVTNNEYVKCGAYKKIIEVATLLVKKNIYTCINTIANDRNANTMSEFVKECEKLGVNGVGIGSVVKVGRGRCLESCEYCSPKGKDYIVKLDKEFRSESMYLSTFIEASKPNSIRCGLYKWVINEKGEILPCAFFPSKKFKIGHITDDPHQIFNEEKFILMQEKLNEWSHELLREKIKLTEICPTLELILQDKEE